MIRCLFGFHDWRLWETYKTDGKRLVEVNYHDVWEPFVALRQRRTCKRCGFLEDERVA